MYLACTPIRALVLVVSILVIVQFEQLNVAKARLKLVQGPGAGVASSQRALALRREMHARLSESPSSERKCVLADVKPATRQDNNDLLKVLVYKHEYENSLIKAEEGGPMGELALFHSLLDALHTSDLVADGGVFLASSPASLDAVLVDTPFDAFDVIFTDQYSFAVLESAGLFHLDLDRCRYRFVDFWGTPPNQNSVCFHLRQYLTPYANEWNAPMFYDATVSGARTTDSAAKLVSQEDIDRELADLPPRFALIYGKDAKYFATARNAIASVARKIPLVSTARNARGRLPPGVITLGVVSKPAWRALLARASFVLGMGHPVIGPTVFDAWSVGTPFINPTFAKPFQLADNTRWALASQHPPAVDLAPPGYIHTLDINNAATLANAVDTILARGRLQPFVPPDYTTAGVATAIDATLRADYCRPLAD
ncbi:uncharacterized protein AMSG_08305 [Thecamonas trahens ATCC 50062]|uniref:alpha-1,6-mannosyl-glycoprotein 6-beta-N-acetylglucosaminyltransferase n=1 Tax=Thecamonas trahens ATCC 50062 TaxID=461836 RepID=A0A0L0DJP9_THETB|nr:hypothetical protein AMSG_08305 [Thecamonas trahens ATCC 50062]KNC52336.1 hypothetical protein AMSG_08305 [Thecamonas trahens ATCC 50062]|eukprot:XP_013755386.1 hypothetical protein AMSG_08305 [Thecamonas trahens ATCC 50062]